MTPHRWDRLPCGRRPQNLLDLAADNTPLAPHCHEATCPYCQGALQQLGDLWEPVRRWASQPAQLPRGFLSAVVARVRRLAQSPHHVAHMGPDGATTVTSWVLGLIAAHAAQSTPGVARITNTLVPPRAGRRHQIRYGADGVDIDEDGETAVAVTLTVATTTPPDPLDTNMHSVAERIRRNVIDAIPDATSIPVTKVDITIDDVDPSGVGREHGSAK